MSNRERRGRHDYWGCWADYDVELGELAERESHLSSTCRGYPQCQYCVEEREPRTCSIETCDRPFYGRNLCAKHYQAWRSRNRAEIERAKGGSRLGCRNVNRKIPKLIQKPNGCLETDSKMATQVFIGKIGHKKLYVRRYVLVLEKKLGRKLRDGYYACHTCDNRLCIAEDHLFEGTQSDNIVDARNKGRLKSPFINLFLRGKCKYGHIINSAADVKTFKNGSNRCLLCYRLSAKIYYEKRKNRVDASL